MVSKRKINIVYIIGTLQVGGAERQMIDTASRVSKELFDVSIFCLFGGGPLQTIAEQQQIEVTISPAAQYYERRHHPVMRVVQTLLALYRYLKRKRPDIVHCYMYKASLYGAIAAHLAHCPGIITNRTSLGSFKDRKHHYQILENMINHFTISILVNSQAEKNNVFQREKVRPEKISMIYNGVDVEKYAPREDQHGIDSLHIHKKQVFGIPAHVPVIGMIANLRPCKGYKEFILAAAKIYRKYPDSRFLCVGKDTGIQEQLEQLRNMLGLHDVLTFTGQVQSALEILPVFDIQVLASYEEGFSNVILEGMAAGKPIVATAVGGTLEQLQHEHTGLLVPPRDADALASAVVRLLDEPEFSRKIGRNARIYAEGHFALDKTIPQLEQLYLQLLHSSG